MKKLIPYRTLLLLFIVFTSSTAISKPVLENAKKDSVPLELHLLKDYLKFPAPGLDEITYKFFDSDDNFIYEAIIQIGEVKERRLVKYLNESNLLTEVSGIKIHRLK